MGRENHWHEAPKTNAFKCRTNSILHKKIPYFQVIWMQIFSQKFHKCWNFCCVFSIVVTFMRTPITTCHLRSCEICFVIWLTHSVSSQPISRAHKCQTFASKIPFFFFNRFRICAFPISIPTRNKDWTEPKTELPLTKLIAPVFNFQIEHKKWC